MENNKRTYSRGFTISTQSQYGERAKRLKWEGLMLSPIFETPTKQVISKPETPTTPECQRILMPTASPETPRTSGKWRSSNSTPPSNTQTTISSFLLRTPTTTPSPLTTTPNKFPHDLPKTPTTPSVLHKTPTTTPDVSKTLSSISSVLPEHMDNNTRTGLRNDLSFKTPPKTPSARSMDSPLIGWRLPEVDKQSIACLEPDKLLNDTVIEFYMNHINQHENVHLFNPFFYNKIKNSQSCDTYRRWDKNVRIFDKDYLVVPICDYKHWVLVIVCYPRHVPAHDDPIVIQDNENVTSSSSTPPSLIIFDSLGYKYLSKFTNPIRVFLNERWKYERPEEESPDFLSRELLKEIVAQVPRQRNAYDCGVYLLNSFERFISNPSHNYKRIRLGDDLREDWKINHKEKRVEIKRIITRENLQSKESKLSIVE